jgi:hypothetical protein
MEMNLPGEGVGRRAGRGTGAERGALAIVKNACPREGRQATTGRGRFPKSMRSSHRYKPRKPPIQGFRGADSVVALIAEPLRIVQNKCRTTGRLFASIRAGCTGMTELKPTPGPRLYEADLHAWATAGPAPLSAETAGDRLRRTSGRCPFTIEQVLDLGFSP